MTRTPEKMCVLAEPYLSPPEVQSLEYAVEHADVTIPLVVVNEPGASAYDPEMEAQAVNGGLGPDTVKLFFEVLRRERAWTVVIAEQKLAALLGDDAASSERIAIEDIACFSDAAVHRIEPERSGHWSSLPAETVELIGDTCDVVVRYGFGLLEEDVLTATEYGVLSFHPADIRRYRGLGPPQAFLDDRDTVGMTLQRLNEDIDGGEIVAYDEVDVRDCATLWEIYDKLSDLQVELLADGLRTLRDPTTEILTPESLGAYYPVDSRRSAVFASRILVKNISGRLDK